MNSSIKYLNNLLILIFQNLGLDISLAKVVVSERQDLSHFQCNAALAGAKALQTNPKDLAQKIVEQISDNNLKVEIAGPGFINISLSDELISNIASSQLTSPDLGIEKTGNKKILIDYGGPNVSKPLHVGHMRTGVVGEAIKQLLRSVGNHVDGDVHLGDWGTPLGMILTNIQDKYPTLPYFDDNFQGEYPKSSPVSIEELEVIYPEASSRYKSDPDFAERALKATFDLQNKKPGLYKLWQQLQDISIKAMTENYQALNISFEYWYGESRYQDDIPKMIEFLNSQNIVQESEGAQVIYMPDEKQPPLILVKKDGAYLYATTDLACIWERVKDGYQEIIYVVDARQSLHFEQVFYSAKLGKLANPDTKLINLGYGTVNGPDGKPLKTRAGGTPKLNDLISDAISASHQKMLDAGVGKEYSESEQADIAKKVGISAIKFSELSNNLAQDYIFDLDRFTSFEGKTGPYILYTTVRINSITQKIGVNLNDYTDVKVVDEMSKNLLLKLSVFSEIIQRSAESLMTHYLAEYLFEVCQEFNRFYHSFNISNANPTDQAHALAICNLTKSVIKKILDIFTIKIPEKM